jgi:L-threonylcarbamoyladenylate synthase
MGGRPRVVAAVAPARLGEAIEEAAAAIRAGGIVAIPTETVYGITASLDARGVDALLAAKARPVEKGITLLVDTLDQAERVALLDDRARRLGRRFWPGPLTLVLPERPEARLPEMLTGGGGAIGVRIPDHDLPRSLARRLGPLPLTSANRSGDPDSRSAEEVVAALGEAVTLVLDGGPSVGGTPSTVVLLLDDGPLRFGRLGAVSAEEVEAAAIPGGD